jgi:phosphoribosylformylglycinamidine synthase
MLEGPIGAAAFNNEFGRPNLAGWFRTFEQRVPRPTAAGTARLPQADHARRRLGNIRAEHVEKCAFPAGTPLVVLGGPAMLIGLGGGAASSMASGASAEDLDFASVQRANPEMERRCQEVIDRCWGRGDDNPILFIHDVGAGGLSNALPELVHDRDGAPRRRALRAAPGAERRPRHVADGDLVQRGAGALRAGRGRRRGWTSSRHICERERCPFAVVGEAPPRRRS